MLMFSYVCQIQSQRPTNAVSSIHARETRRGVRADGRNNVTIPNPNTVSVMNLLVFVQQILSRQEGGMSQKKFPMVVIGVNAFF